ncbi:hypothetical protein ACIG3E_32750 [Streptomyces sp. NPDC053474]|uniref:hypothetical protein n=1 Tax=Streptomyces sp. NPDC053474 TaxID=3365704 RepID=UPI0037D37916
MRPLGQPRCPTAVAPDRRLHLHERLLMRLADLPPGLVLMTGAVATAIQARDLCTGDLFTVNGTTITVTGAGHHDLPGMTRLPVSYRPYDNDTVRTENWTLPETVSFTPVQLLRGDRIACLLCPHGTNRHDVVIDRASEGWVKSWVCNAHHQLGAA